MAEPPSDIFAGNPYLRTGEQLSSDQLKQVRLATIGQMLTGLGVGIAQAGPAGQPWYAGIAPGAAAASHAIHETQQDFARQQAVAEELRQREMERQSREAYQGLQTEVIRRNLAFQDLAMKRLGMIQAPQGGAPGMNVRAPAVQMGPQGFANNFGNIRESNADFGGKGAPYNGFETFDSPQSGASAMVANLAAYAKDNPNITVAQAIAKWAPPNENNTAAYVAKVAQGGIDPNAPLASVLKNPIDAVPLLQSMTMQEKGALPEGAPQLFGGAVVSSPSMPLAGPTMAQATMPPGAPVAPSPAASNPPGVGPSLQPTMPGGTGKFPHPGPAPTAESTGLAPVIAYGGPILSKDAELKLQDLQKQHAYAMEQYEQQSATPSPLGAVRAKTDVEKQIAQTKAAMLTPDVQQLVAGLPSSERASFNAYMERGDVKEARNILDAAQGGIPFEERNLSGADFLRRVQERNPAQAELVKGVLDGSISVGDDLTQRANQAGVDTSRTNIIAMAKKADPSFSPSLGESRRRFVLSLSDSNTQAGAGLAAINTAPQHIAQFIDLMSALKNGQIDKANDLVNKYRESTGDARVTNARALQHILASEIGKAVKGSGQLVIPEVDAQLQTLETSASPDQALGSARVVTNALMGRFHTLEDTAKRYNIPEKEIEGYIGPHARQSLTYISGNNSLSKQIQDRKTPVSNSLDEEISRRGLMGPKR